MYEIEVTDTFGGQANYCWVRRERVNAPEAKAGDDAYADQRRVNRWLVRRAKAFAGWTGHRCETYSSGDMIEIRPRGVCQVAFVHWVDE